MSQSYAAFPIPALLVTVTAVQGFAAAQDARPTSAPTPAAEKTVTLRGRVLDGRGLPIEGAALLAGLRDELMVDAVLAAGARTGKDGQLRVSVPWPPPTDGPRATWSIAAKGKVAVVCGYHPAFHTELPPDELELGDVVLFDAVTLRGRIVDAEGRPIARARVTATDGLRPQYEPPIQGGASMQCFSQVQSDEQGRFVLPCVPDGGVELAFAHAGHYEQRLFPVGRETPLTIELRPSGFVSGRTFDADGNGFATALTIVYECGAFGVVRSGAHGSFRFDVAQPGRYRVRNYPGARADVPSLVSPVLEGPRSGLELRPAAATAGPAVLVRGVAEASGEELEFRALGIWDGRANMNPTQLQLHLGMLQFTASDATRRVRLQPPAGKLSGTVLVVARGHAPQAASVLLDEAGPAKELTVKLGPEARIAGRLVDEAGKGIAGARVWAIQVQPNTFSSYGHVPKHAVQSDADGAFQIGGLAGGSYVVQALHADRPVPETVRAETTPAKPAEAVVVRIPAGFTLRGRLAGGDVDAACWLRIEDAETGRARAVGRGAGGAFFNNDPPRTVRVAADGTFQCDRLGAKTYRVVLVRPTFSRFTGPVEFVLGEVELTKDQARDFEVKDCVVQRLSGSVELGDAQIPFDRLLVVARPQLERRGREDLALLGKTATAGIDRAGRFTLDLPPGSHDLRVVDAATGVTLHETESPAAIRAGQEANVRLALALTRVEVKLVPSTAGAPIRLRALVIEALQAQADRLQTMFGAVMPGADGLRIDPGQQELTCWLPAGEYRLRAQSHAGSLTAGNTYRTLELATQTISVPAKGTLPVALEVAPPPEVPETEK